MTDRTLAHVKVSLDESRLVGAQTRGASPWRTRRQSSTRARIAVAGIGFSAMLALVGSMELTEGRASAVVPVQPSTPAVPRTVVVVHKGAPPKTLVAAAGVSSHPIVLTAHAKVRTVQSAASGGSATVSSSGGSGYVAASSSSGSVQAAAPAAAAPVASTSGSH